MKKKGGKERKEVRNDEMDQRERNIYLPYTYNVA